MATRGGRDKRGGRRDGSRSSYGDSNDRNPSQGRGRGRGREFQGGRRGRGRGEAHRPRGNNEADGMLPQPNVGSAKRFWSIDHMKRMAATRGDEIVDKVFDDQGGFFNLLKDHRTIEKSFTMRLIIKIIYNITSCSNPAAEKVTILLAQIGSETYAMFYFNLTTLIRKMPMEQSQNEREENLKASNQLIDIFTQMLNVCPLQCAHLLPVHDLYATAVSLQQQSPRYSELVTRCDKLKELHAQSMKHGAQNTTSHPNKGTQAPQENYCVMPILPRVVEITQNSKPDLECNIVEGAYTDWNHYFSVQFRLLREDFISPLRQGICDYSHGDQLRSRQHIRVYKHVYVNEPICLYSGIGFQLQFDVSHLRHIQWEHSRRLIFGSLLCLSSDEFTTVWFASVVKRDPKLLKEGYITVKFEGDVNAFEIEPQTEFTMVESTAYFEAYRHILCRLQTFRTPPPFKAYIVDCKPPSPLPPPSYLKGKQYACYDLTALEFKNPVQLLDSRAWPHHEEVNLDKSQLAAVQMALTQELSLIQGPPGTGKTYIGLKIVEILLQNKQIWDSNMTSPILVVCYTNHALDQFLEGILKFNDKTNIIRIGGRSKCKELEPYMLRKIVDQCHAARSFAHRSYKQWKEARMAMKQEQRNICERMHDVSNMSMEGKLKILNFRTLEHVMQPDHANQLRALLHKYHVTEEGKEIEFWLGIWFFASKDGDLDNGTNIESAKIDEEVLVTEQVVLPEAAAAGGGDNARHDATETDADGELVEVDAEAILLENDRIIDGERVELEPIKLDSIIKSTTKKATKPGVHHDEYGWQVQQLSEQQRKQRISKGMKNKPMNREKAAGVVDISQIELKKRWSLYRYWVNQHVHECKQAVVNHVDIYKHACDDYQDAQSDLETSVLCNAAVVGMTTTGAAKYHSILHKMRPKIIIIEEAAEVLESHIVTTLTASTQQVIMIGDHQQLRPKPNDYRLATEYNLEVSLFERLVTNKIAFATLEVQHRMRPEVARLICPHIYEKLINARTVCGYDRVRGIKHDVFFINHSVPEDDSHESDMLSHSNIFEAEFAVGLCHYFIKLGYRRSQITILTMYSGQLLKMRNLLPKAVFDGVRVSAVDDFQGEENDIIILSLVRSNDDGKIGFLKESNRVCVALSRAKKGLFVIGNFSMLRDKGEPWPSIIDEMDKKGLVQNGLPLYCSVHDTVTLVCSGYDFNKVPEGGCLKLCGTRLSCGHSCPRLCHPGIQDHKGYHCRKKCSKTLACGHQCTGYCYQCSQGCNPCSRKVPKHLSCGHRTNVECGISVDSVVCTQNCTKRLPCGHYCTERCGAPCNPLCREVVIKDLTCGHKVREPCFKPLDLIKCHETCQEVLLCGHPCAGSCSECHMGRLHKACQSPCGRTLPCGHNCDFPCTNECPLCTQPCGNYCNHSKCRKKCGEPCVPCMEDCQWKCRHFKCSKRCGEMCDRPRCNIPCTKQLKCRHPCIGLCGEKCPTWCRICNKEFVTEIFFGEEDEPDARFIQLEDCGHIFEVSGLDQWMDQQDSSTDGKAVDIQFKCCPRCKTSVRRSLRYGNIIKQTLVDVEGVKKQILGADNNRNELWRANKEKLRGLLLECQTKNCFKLVKKFFDKITQQLEPIHTADRSRAMKKAPHCQLSLHHLNAIQYQLANLPKLVKLLESLQDLKYSSKFQFGHIVIDLTEARSQLISLCDFTIQDYIYEQIQADVECEFNRLSILIQVCQLNKHLSTRTSSSNDTALLSDIMFRIYYAGWRKEKITSTDVTNYRAKLTEIGKRYGLGCITEDERIEIVKAIGLSKGHWYKCPNGHYYCIGECGGAMQVAKCPECKANIGGTHHRLVDGNVHAGEMDGSRHAAWSEAANLENYPALFR